MANSERKLANKVYKPYLASKKLELQSDTYRQKVLKFTNEKKASNHDTPYSAYQQSLPGYSVKINTRNNSKVQLQSKQHRHFKNLIKNIR